MIRRWLFYVFVPFLSLLAFSGAHANAFADGIMPFLPSKEEVNQEKSRSEKPKLENPKKVDSISAIPSICPVDSRVVGSWNLGNFGRSKTDREYAIMSVVLRAFDVVAVQEVSTSNFGSQAVARLSDELSRKGADWRYALSDRTESVPASSERYAFLYRPSRISVVPKSNAFMRSLIGYVDREPYRITVSMGKESVQVVNFHAVPAGKKPIREIRALLASEEIRAPGNRIVLGDFNYDGAEMRKAFADAGYRTFDFGKTSLKTRQDKYGDYASKPYDHIFIKGNMRVCAYGTIPFPDPILAQNAENAFRDARKVSDHMPIFVAFSFLQSD